MGIWDSLLKLPPSELELWLVLWTFFLLRLLFISINLQNGLEWNTATMSGPVLLATTCIYLDKLQKRVFRIAGLWFAVSLEPSHLNIRDWFHFLILVTGPLVTLIGYMTFVSPFLDFIRMSLSIVSFLVQLESVILCRQDASIWPMM